MKPRLASATRSALVHAHEADGRDAVALDVDLVAFLHLHLGRVDERALALLLLPVILQVEREDAELVVAGQLSASLYSPASRDSGKAPFPVRSFCLS